MSTLKPLRLSALSQVTRNRLFASCTKSTFFLLATNCIIGSFEAAAATWETFVGGSGEAGLFACEEEDVTSLLALLLLLPPPKRRFVLMPHIELLLLLPLVRTGECGRVALPSGVL